MADREIRLVGSFKDDITPKLRKLTQEIESVTKSFTKMQSKLRPIARDMGVLAMASERVADGMRAQRSSMEANIRAMQQYKTTVGQVARAQRAIKPTVLPPAQLPRAPQVPRGGGGAPPPVYGGGGPGMAAGAFGVTLGGTLSNVMTNAIIRGFQMGTQLMYKPFQFLQRGLQERIQDEMSDVRAAGGLFSISKRMEGGGFVSSFGAAETLTKETNRYLAELAGALPGDTQEYINVSKQISDGIYTMIANDKDNAIKLAEKIAAENGRVLKATQGQAGMQAAGKELVGEMTKLTVLAGLGGQQGAFGLPQLTERMISQQEVSMGMFTKYAAIFRDPMIKGALERNLKNINQAGANTAARMEAIRNTFQEIVTPELVRRYQRTTAGVLEALKTTFLNPEVGMLGLGRPLGLAANKFDEFGNQLFVLSRDIIGENGKKIEKGSEITADALRKLGYSVNDVAKAATENLSVFDYLRDIFANVMIVLQPVIEAATKLFDPFEALGSRLERLREATMKFQLSFEQYRGGLEKIAAGLKGEQKASFQATLTLRASLAAINNAFANLGVYGEAEFQKIASIVKDPTKGFGDFAKVIQDMVQQFLSSEGAAKIGEAIGGVIGTVVATVGQMIAQIAGIATSGKLAEGFAKGFKDAGGVEGFRQIIQSVFKLMGQAIVEAFKAAPFEVSLIAGLVLFGPAIAAAVGTAIVGAIPRLMSSLLKGGGAAGALRGAAGVQGPMRTASGTRGLMVGGAARGAGRQTAGALGRINQAAAPGVAAAGRAVAAQAPQAAQAAGAARGALGAVAKAGKMKGIGLAAAGIVKMSTMGPQMAKLGKFATNFGKNIPFLNVAFAGLDFAARKAEGQDTAKAASGAGGALAGSIIGGAIGTAIPIPVVGTAVGAAIGGGLGGWLGEKLPGLLSGIGPMFSTAFTGIINFFKGLPGMLVGAIQAIPGLLKAAFDGIINFFRNIPFALAFAVGFTIQVVQNAWNGLVQFFTVTIPAAWTSAVTFVQSTLSAAWNGVVAFFFALPGMMAAAWASLVAWARSLPSTIGGAFMSFIAYAATIPGQITNALAQVGSAIVNWAKGIPGRVLASLGQGFQAGKEAAKPRYDGKGRSMPLGAAIATEMKHKPPGSSLVIANSSETVIPAYKGLNMGAAAMINSLKAVPAAEGMGGSSNINMSGITINVNGANKNGEEIAEEVAAHLLTAMYKASYANDGRQG